ncbi:hypothetical protein JZ751_018937 [Albula glossodonta]|uniref:Uncharacterized protein n=1 Tax=Albula glossodonta TaxID=121402 RepID=A0A8T2MTY8_9TELE|nr:hypothetical protein JZ751_018937 [Albula glossodonta]
MLLPEPPAHTLVHPHTEVETNDEETLSVHSGMAVGTTVKLIALCDYDNMKVCSAAWRINSAGKYHFIMFPGARGHNFLFIRRCFQRKI